MAAHIDRQIAPSHSAVDTLEDEKKLDLEAVPHVEYAQEDVALQGAMFAEQEEAQMTLKQALRDYKTAVFWSFAISLCIIMEGYDTALPGNFYGLPAFRQKFGTYIDAEHGYQISAAWQTGLGYAGGVGSILSIFVTAGLQQKYGYRRIIQGGLVGMFCSIFLQFFAVNLAMYAVALHCCGWSWGVFQASVVSYASEITPVALRGYLTTYVNLCWIIGQFLAAGVLKAVSTRTDEWGFRIPFAVQWIWPIPLIILIQFAPESPWYLVRKGRLDEAASVIIRVQKKDSKINPRDTIAMMIRTDEHEKKVSAGTSYWDCFKGSDLRRTEIACVAWASQNLCGLSFAGSFVYFLEQLGVSATDAYSFNIGSVAMAFCGTIGSWYVLNKFGRRTIMLYGSTFLTAMLFVIGCLTFSKAKAGKWVQAVLMMTWVLIFDLSIGPLAYCIVGETSSTRLRGLTVGLARNAYNLVGMPFGTIFNFMLNPTAWDLGGYTAFFAAGTAGLVTLWIFFRLPEMKGRTYRELDIFFERGVSARKFASTRIDPTEEE